MNLEDALPEFAGDDLSLGVFARLFLEHVHPELIPDLAKFVRENTEQED